MGLLSVEVERLSARADASVADCRVLRMRVAELQALVVGLRSDTDAALQRFERLAHRVCWLEDRLRDGMGD